MRRTIRHGGVASTRSVGAFGKPSKRNLIPRRRPHRSDHRRKPATSPTVGHLLREVMEVLRIDPPSPVATRDPASEVADEARGPTTGRSSIDMSYMTGHLRVFKEKVALIPRPN